jgi:inhibitor of KinA
MTKGMILSRYGEDGIRIQFGNTIDVETNEKVRRYYYFIKSQKIEDVIDIVPSYASCLIHFDLGTVTYHDMLDRLRHAVTDIASAAIPDPSMHEIPVHYAGDYGPDMPLVCSLTGLNEEEVISIHSSTLYRVFTVGFIPGFPYLGILDERLNVPRLETPRVRVPKGSIGIAQLQTGVYTFESPGGWRIIGRTDVEFFTSSKEPYSLMQLGDIVRFVPV